MLHFFEQGIATLRPSLYLPFALTKTLDPRITFTRNSAGSLTDAALSLQSAGINVARFTHDPASGESLGLVDEDSRVNALRNNTMVGAAAGTPGSLPTNWSIGGFSGVTQQVVGTGTYNGVPYLDMRFSGTTTGPYGDIYFETATYIAATNGQSWASSAWVQIVSGSSSNVSSINLYALQYSSTPAFIGQATNGAQSASVNTSWQRISRAFTVNNASTATISTSLSFTWNIGVAIDLTIRVGLPQMELGSGATSVIPTSGSTVARAADVASIEDLSGFLRQYQGSLLVRVRPTTIIGTRPILYFDDGTTNNCIAVRGNAANAELYIRAGGVDQAQVVAGAVTAGTAYRLAASWRAGQCAVSLNGGAPVVGAPGTMPAVSRLLIGSDGVNYNNGTIASASYYKDYISPDRLSRLSV